MHFETLVGHNKNILWALQKAGNVFGFFVEADHRNWFGRVFVQRKVNWEVGVNAKSMFFCMGENGDVFILSKFDKLGGVFEKTFSDLIKVCVGVLSDKSCNLGFSFFLSPVQGTVFHALWST